MMRNKGLRYGLALLAASVALMCAVVPAQAADKKPNILVIWGDDIGYWNVSAYNQGMMGYKTPNIDRIAKEGSAVHRLVRSAELHCWAGGIHHRTVAVPDRPVESWAARCQGRASGEGRHHSRAAQGAGIHDGTIRQEPPRRPRRAPAHRARLPRVLGSLYHLNAEDEPEHEDYFKDPALRKRYGTCGVIHTWANPDGTQKIESTGALRQRSGWRPSTMRSPRRRSAS